MHVLHVFAQIDATSPFACLKYLQIRAIRANTNNDTCKYIHQIRANTNKIRSNTSVGICMYMLVYACI
jgi:hypothetical protein